MLNFSIVRKLYYAPTQHILRRFLQQILDNYWMKSSFKLLIMSIKSETALIFLLIILKMGLFD